MDPADLISLSLSAVPFWAFVGTFYIIRLTWQDFRNKRMVDDRFNWFMLGVTITLITSFRHPFWYIISMLGIVIALRMLINKFKLLGAADAGTITWTFWGYALINPVICLVYGFIFSIITLLYFGLKRAFFGKEWRKPTPFYPVFLLACVITNIIFGMYV